jgi:serine/threonine protein kinase
VHDYFEHDGTPYIAMEHVEQGSLRPHVGRMSLGQISGVLEGVLAALEAAEHHGVVHRDLKPENLMVTADGRIKIADFGIVKATTRMQTGAFVTATGVTVGTPAYMAPEQAMAQDIGPWTDLYSVGCMAFEMFTGRVPFHDSDAPMAILLRHVNEPIPPVKAIYPGWIRRSATGSRRWWSRTRRSARARQPVRGTSSTRSPTGCSAPAGGARRG